MISLAETRVIILVLYWQLFVDGFCFKWHLKERLLLVLLLWDASHGGKDRLKKLSVLYGANSSTGRCGFVAGLF